jgi:hypothetical protein
MKKSMKKSVETSVEEVARPNCECPCCEEDDWESMLIGPEETHVFLGRFTVPLVAEDPDGAEAYHLGYFVNVDECQSCGCVVSI